MLEAGTIDDALLSRITRLAIIPRTHHTPHVSHHLVQEPSKMLPGHGLRLDLASELSSESTQSWQRPWSFASTVDSL